jgi:hypothetical protein
MNDTLRSGHIQSLTGAMVLRMSMKQAPDKTDATFNSFK